MDHIRIASLLTIVKCLRVLPNRIENESDRIAFFVFRSVRNRKSHLAIKFSTIEPFPHDNSFLVWLWTWNTNKYSFLSHHTTTISYDIILFQWYWINIVESIRQYSSMRTIPTNSRKSLNMAMKLDWEGDFKKMHFEFVFTYEENYSRNAKQDHRRTSNTWGTIGSPWSTYRELE